jgi:hypothetical protein
MRIPQRALGCIGYCMFPSTEAAFLCMSSEVLLLSMRYPAKPLLDKRKLCDSTFNIQIGGSLGKTHKPSTYRVKVWFGSASCFKLPGPSPRVMYSSGRHTDQSSSLINPHCSINVCYTNYKGIVS